MPDLTQLKKTIRLILNILFVIVVAAAIYIGWGKEVDDPEAWFPEWVEEKEEPAQAPAQPESSKEATDAKQ